MKILNYSKTYPTKLIGYVLKISFITIAYSTSFAAVNSTKKPEPVSFSCENTRQINGAFNQVLPIQKIKISKAKIFDEFIAANNINDDFTFLKNGKIYTSFNNENKVIDLNKIEKSLALVSSKNYNLWIDFEFGNNSSQMNITPLFQPLQKKSQHKMPYAKIFFFNEQTPISKSLGLPKNAQYIQAGAIYKEYNHNYDMLNRLARTVNSAYLYDAVSCVVKNDLDFSNINLVGKNFEDVTLDYEKWPNQFLRLKQSIAQIIFDSYLRGDIDQRILDKYKIVFSEVNISNLALESTINLHHIKEDVQENITSFLNSLPKKDTNELVFRFFDKSMMVGEVLTTQEIDNSPRAKKFNSFNITNKIDTSLLTHVTLTKTVDNKYYFYFHSNGNLEHHIGIGPIDFKKLYWKDSTIAYNSCTELTMKHFNEYERKAFLFFAKKDLEIKSFTDLQKISEYQKYPLEEFIITNNCRGAGNIEFEWPGIVKGYFQVPTPVMRKIIDTMDKSEVKFDNLYTEVRLTKFYSDKHQEKLSPDSIKNYLLSLWSKYKEDDYKWIRFNNTDAALSNCKAQDVTKNLITQIKANPNISFKYEMGNINYSEFLGETRMKSGHLGEKDPIIYTHTPCNEKETKMEIPFRLTTPRHQVAKPIKDYWNEQTCEIIPYRFEKYSDLLKYPVYLSKFEVDGVYTGQSLTYEQHSMSDNDIKLMKNSKERMLFDFKNIYSFKNLEYIDEGDYFSLVFSSENKKFNFIIGNISKKTLDSEYKRNAFQSYSRPWANDTFRGIYSLIGINPYSLSNFYNADQSEEKPLFSLFYDQNGNILNHHDTKIGIEQFYIRQTNQGIQLDILSHERITPVARIIINENSLLTSK